MAISYAQAFVDHLYLWTQYGPAHDMTGGYVDQEDLWKLLRSPNKATARDCLVDQINYWFDVGPDGLKPDPSDLTLQEIAERYSRDIGSIRP